MSTGHGTSSPKPKKGSSSTVLPPESADKSAATNSRLSRGNIDHYNSDSGDSNGDWAMEAESPTEFDTEQVGPSRKKPDKKTKRTRDKDGNKVLESFLDQERRRAAYAIMTNSELIMMKSFQDNATYASTRKKYHDIYYGVPARPPLAQTNKKDPKSKTRSRNVSGDRIFSRESSPRDDRNE